MGHAGRELDKMLFEAGILPTNCLFATLVNARPAGNEFTHFLHPNSDKAAPTFRGCKPKQELLDGYDKLLRLIHLIKPKLIIGAGNWPLWALTDKAKVATQQGYKLPGGVSKWRGSQLFTQTEPSIPFLPIIHPATILRSWDLRSVTVHDLRARAGRFIKGEIDWNEPHWDFNHAPSPTEIIERLHTWICQAIVGPLPLSIDLETYQRKWISCIGIADLNFALCIPLFHFNESGQVVDYLPRDDEITIMYQLACLLRNPNVRVIGQNFNYDVQWFQRHLGVGPRVHFDTMLAHHLLWPGTPKSLDYLASLYCNHYVYWKDESQEWDTGLSHEDLWRYNCRDVRATYDIAVELRKHISTAGMDSQFEFQLDQWTIAADMSRRGCNYDLEERKRMSTELFHVANETSDWLLQCMPESCRYAPSGKPWYASPTYCIDLFYRQLGLPAQLHKKTKRPSFDGYSLDQLRTKAPWLRPVFDKIDLLRSISVFRSHFLDAQPSLDGRLRCSFNVGGTSTFRWSSNSNSFGEGTNLQNIPKGEED